MRKILVAIAFVFMLFCTAAGQTDLYNRYASRTDIRVASVTNFVLDSGILADVTLLEAREDAGWAWLCDEFGLSELSPEQQKQVEEGRDVSLFTQRCRKDPTLPPPIMDDRVDMDDICYVGVSYLSRTIYIFCCNGGRQSEVMVNYLIQKMRHALQRGEGKE